MTDDQSNTEAIESNESKPPGRTFLGFNGTYWMCNAVEMWERLAYYTLRPVAPIYIMQADEPGGLHLTAEHKGWIFLWWFILQSLFPMVTGGIGGQRLLGDKNQENCRPCVHASSFEESGRHGTPRNFLSEGSLKA